MTHRGFRLIAVSLLTSIVAAFAVPPLHAADANVPPPTDASVKRQKWVEKEVLKAYDEVGRRNAKWDEAARQALRLTVDEWSGVRPRLDGAFAQFQAAKRAVEAGCDDPMILYVYAETYKTFGDDAQKCRDLHNQAADAFPGTDYSGYYKSMAQFRAAQLQFEMANEHGRAAGKYNMDELNAGMRRIAVGIGNMVELSHETDVPMGKWINLGYAMQDAMVFTSGGDQAVRWALPEIEKRAPKLAALVIKGELYTHWAWDARGSDFANKVTDEGWKLMASRLQTAQMALEEAWKLDPTCIDIPIRMITLELGQGQGRDRMELWFKRAMAIDPDSENACEAKLYYLEPKWYGTPRDVIQFGHECLQTGRFNSNVPRMLERAHKTLSHYTHGGYSTKSDPAYYRLPGVWADLQAVYEGYLAADKDLHPTHLRNEYARYACLCGAWDDATKIFATIGDDVDQGVWTKEQFEAARKAAANGAK
jgi:hypothetical protein